MSAKAKGTRDYLAITVYGEPAPQGSKRHVGNGIMIESSKKVKPWREAVKMAALVSMDGRGGVAGPVRCELVFTLRKPKSAPKRRRTYPDRKPDLDKLVRSTFDALTDVGAIEDDAKVIGLITRKVYPLESATALKTPGAVIVIRSVE